MYNIVGVLSAAIARRAAELQVERTPGDGYVIQNLVSV